jgi:histidine triad (HIT) family protein
MSECIFCQIVDGEIPADVVYEDEHTVAFLDANPLAEGHTLVIPREHRERVGNLPEDEAGEYFRSVPKIVDAVENAVGADGATVAFNDGSAAGQEVPHAHLHIVPREHGDKHGPIHSLFTGADPTDEETDDLREAIEARL